MRYRPPRMRRAVVFGASSAIAAEVVATWAARGDRLHLVARDPGKLAAVAARCTGAEVTTTIADLSDLDRAAALVDEAAAALAGPIDVVLIAHGDLGDQQRSEH